MKTEWVHKKLGDCCERICNGLTYDVEETQGYFVTRIETISDGYIDYNKIGHIPDKPNQDYLMVNGDILFSHINSVKHIGKVAYYDDSTELYHGMNLLLLRANNNIDKLFLFYLLLSDKYRRKIRTLAKSAVNQASISTTDLGKFEISYPADLSAQRRIAAILASADKVIAATQKTIAKYKQMKQGMMEELFNEQCTMNNVQWRKVRLGECLKQKPDYGINAPAVPYDNNLPTYLRITDITEDGYYSKKDIVSVSSQDALKYVMEEGDLVFARTGASTGKAYLYNPKDGMLVFAGFLIRVRTDGNVLLPEYLKYQTQTPQYKNWIAANSMRTGQPGINGNEYEEFPISIPFKNGKPDLSEQCRIAAILSGIDAKIAAEEKVLEKYEKVKKGLMERLLEEENER